MINEEGPRHRFGRLHRRLRRRGAAARAATRSSASTTSRSTARSPSRTTTTRTTTSSRATCATTELMTELLVGLRPLHRRRGPDRRHLVLPHLRLRPARHERADHRLVAATPRSRRTTAGSRCKKVTYMSSSMVFESTDRWPSQGGRRAQGPAAAVVVRLPEARGRVLRPGGLGPVPAAVHDRAPVQLRRHRRVPRPRRRRDRLRQRQARDEPRRARPGAEGRSRARTRCTSSAPATRSATTPTAATWPAASSTRWSTRTPCNDDFNLSTAEVDTRARAGRGHLAQDQGRRTSR